MRRLRTVSILLLLVGLEAGVANADYVRLLLPLYTSQPIPGAYGSMWQTYFAMHNASPDTSYVILPCAPTQGCPLDLRADEELLPNETQTALPARFPLPQNAIGGAVVWILPETSSADIGDSIAFQLRVADLSRSATSAGTEIPVVREREFRQSKVTLLNIPVDSRFRLAFRIFEMNLSHADFAVRIYDQSDGHLLSEHVVQTVTTVTPREFTPAFAQLNLDGEEMRVAHFLRIEVEPLTSRIAFWSYVSITNDETQQITLVTPQ